MERTINARVIHLTMDIGSELQQPWEGNNPPRMWFSEPLAYQSTADGARVQFCSVSPGSSSIVQTFSLASDRIIWVMATCMFRSSSPAWIVRPVCSTCFASTLVWLFDIVCAVAGRLRTEKRTRGISVKRLCSEKYARRSKTTESRHRHGGPRNRMIHLRFSSAVLAVLEYTAILFNASRENLRTGVYMQTTVL